MAAIRVIVLLPRLFAGLGVSIEPESKQVVERGAFIGSAGIGKRVNPVTLGTCAERAGSIFRLPKCQEVGLALVK